MSLEDDAPTPETPPPPEIPTEAAPTPQQAAPQADEGDPDGTIEGSGGVKFVPLSAVAEAREKLRTAKAEAEAIRAEAAQLREKAQKFDQVAGEWQAAQPLLQQLRNGTYQPAPVPQKAAGPLTHQDAIEYAKDLDLYKADGTPDVDRAQRLAARQQAIAEQQAKTLVQPIYQDAAVQKSQAHLQAAMTYKDPNGVPIDKTLLQSIWNMVPPELSSQPGVASILLKMAVAESIQQGKYKIPTAPPPPAVHTESIGGGAPPVRELSSLERGFAQAANIKTKDFEEISSRFKPGERNVLE